jgi:hypothetical protein
MAADRTAGEGEALEDAAARCRFDHTSHLLLLSQLVEIGTGRQQRSRLRLPLVPERPQEMLELLAALIEVHPQGLAHPIGVGPLQVQKAAAQHRQAHHPSADQQGGASGGGQQLMTQAVAAKAGAGWPGCEPSF